MTARQRFTLVELMMVIAVIAVLAAVALPVLHDAQLRSRHAEVEPMMDAIVNGSIGWVTTAEVPGGGSGAGPDPAWPSKSAQEWPKSDLQWWSPIAVTPTGATYCSYDFSVRQDNVEAYEVYANAKCDLDGDGDLWSRHMTSMPISGNTDSWQCGGSSYISCDPKDDKCVPGWTQYGCW